MKIFRVLLLSPISILLVALIATPAAAFSLSGRYEGMVACDSTTAGNASTLGWRIELLIAQNGTDLRVEYKYIDKAELGAEYTLYSGKAVMSPDGRRAIG